MLVQLIAPTLDADLGGIIVSCELGHNFRRKFPVFSTVVGECPIEASDFACEIHRVASGRMACDHAGLSCQNVPRAIASLGQHPRRHQSDERRMHTRLRFAKQRREAADAPVQTPIGRHGEFDDLPSNLRLSSVSELSRDGNLWGRDRFHDGGLDKRLDDGVGQSMPRDSRASIILLTRRLRAECHQPSSPERQSQAEQRGKADFNSDRGDPHEHRQG